jgi:hypothetical protein
LGITHSNSAQARYPAPATGGDDLNDDGRETTVNWRARIRNPQDVAAGLLFAAIGIATVVAAIEYPMGTVRRFGPGYFPVLLGGLLALLGAAIAIKGVAIRPEGAEPIGPWALRPLILIGAAVVAFALLVRPLGLAAATVTLVTVTSLAGAGFSLKRVVVLSVALTALAAAIFIYTLGLPFTLWPAIWN